MISSRLHTFTGRGFDPLNPRAEDVQLEDIAHHLGNTCRFGGATPKFYSVAQHAVLVALMVLEASRRPDWALLALHHDSAEAYIGDWPRPIKHGVVFIRGMQASKAIQNPQGYVQTPIAVAEARIQDAILEGLGITDDIRAHEMIRNADNSMLRAELHGLFGERPDAYTGACTMETPPISPATCMTPEDAKLAFLRRDASLRLEIRAMP